MSAENPTERQEQPRELGVSFSLEAARSITLDHLHGFHHMI